SPFLSRPFTKRMFVINPDRLALVYRERIEYAVNPRDTAEKPEMHIGEALYSFEHVDYEFEEPPARLNLKTDRITKTRVGMLPNLSSEERMQALEHLVGEAQQVDYAKRYLG